MDNESEIIWFRYYKRERDLIKESPIRSGSFDSFDYEDDNPEVIYKRVVNPDSGYKLIHTQKHSNGKNIYLYELHEGGDDYDIKLLTDDLNVIIGHISYSRLSDGGVEVVSVYNQSLFKGAIFKVYFDYFLEKYNYILSGGVHSPKGEIFWEKIATVGKNNGYRIKVVDIDQKNEYIIDNIEDIKKYYNKEGYRIKIERKF